ncbi:MAG: D-glycero-beta-D-manno-heptose-7-phosphate kinase [Bacteroidetes bacterium]|nr:D-glycero-beta-D-manno-heptose-7-phosphate kinase [Bacteroidota bacterium]
MTKEEITSLFNNFNKLNVLIIGDVMIDAYYFGKVDRISPEAPVPVVSVQRKENRLGGAANVALNIQELGANPILCSVIGNDDDAIIFDKLLASKKLSNQGIINSSNRITTVKTRIIGNNHQMLRVDAEIDNDLIDQDKAELIAKIIAIINQQKIDAVVFEDYDKGIISSVVIEEVVNICNEKNIPTTVDPKKRNFLHYHNVSLFKPNLKELKEGLNIEINPKELENISTAVAQLNNQLNNKITFITLSEYGVYIAKQNKQHLEKAHVRNISDVSGAGDTVISVATLCLALKQPIEIIAALSNLAGGIVCEKVGVVPIQKDELLAEALIKLI